MVYSKHFDYLAEFMNCEVDIPYNTPIKDYLRGKVVFVTGSTGFLGQLYVEKLLRCEVKFVYILARPKRGKSAEARIKELFEGVLFSKLFRQDEDYIKRIKIMEGNMGQLKLGLSESNIEDINENVEIVIHAAASVRFDDPLRKLLLVNLRGTREMLRLAENMKKLQVFSYISTAFSHSHRGVIDEKFYSPPLDPNIMIKLGEKFENDPTETLEILQERLIKPWVNTYTYTKALSEEMVRSFRLKFPICVMRPTIVISTHEDPISGWCNNVYGLNGVLVACGMGILRLMPLRVDYTGDIICADFVTNLTFAAVWATHEDYKSYPQKYLPDKDPVIYHCSSFHDSPTKWGAIYRRSYEVFAENPAKRMLWKHCPNSVLCPFMWKLLTILYHVIPGIFFDLYLSIINRQERLMPVYRKVQRFMSALQKFMLCEYVFANTNMRKLLNRMSEEDQEFFPCDVKRYSWENFVYNYVLGLKHYIGGEDLNDSEKARKRYKKLCFFHYIIVTIYYTINYSLLYCVLNYYGYVDYLKDNIMNCYEFVLGSN